MNYGIGAHYNGEEYIFKKLATRFKGEKKKPILFDVGANFGQTIILFDNLFTDATIHSFEPGSFSYNQIKDSKLQNPKNNLKVNNFGLSDIKGDTILYTSSTKEMSGSSSMYEENLDVFTTEKSIKETITLTTLDSYCKENNITHIDFLKLDIEGNEYNCFLGGRNIIEDGGIDFIQFEFNHCSIEARRFFIDYWNLLSKHYNFYRELSFRHGITKIEKYDVFYEQFYATNYFLVKKSINF